MKEKRKVQLLQEAPFPRPKVDFDKGELMKMCKKIQKLIRKLS